QRLGLAEAPLAWRGQLRRGQLGDRPDGVVDLGRDAHRPNLPLPCAALGARGVLHRPRHGQTGPMSWLLLGLGIVWLVDALSALSPRKRPLPIFVWSFVASWLVIELVWHHLVIGV